MKQESQNPSQAALEKQDLPISLLIYLIPSISGAIIVTQLVPYPLFSFLLLFLFLLTFSAALEVLSQKISDEKQQNSWKILGMLAISGFTLYLLSSRLNASTLVLVAGLLPLAPIAILTRSKLSSKLRYLPSLVLFWLISFISLSIATQSFQIYSAIAAISFCAFSFFVQTYLEGDLLPSPVSTPDGSGLLKQAATAVASKRFIRLASLVMIPLPLLLLESWQALPRIFLLVSLLYLPIFLYIRSGQVESSPKPKLTLTARETILLITLFFFLLLLR